MAASTTLITFMVRTPPTTLSVALYGSWDNFSTPYPMSRDVRLGKEHWSGCHSFENIICDGNVDALGYSRRGGLKMGGTYWYYYKLDDEIEFHNSAEPATTRCPLLPGQLVNELEVPVVLSGSRNREASVSSTSSEQRTLDPEDKFVNPRPVPTPPKLMRLKTSPNIIQESESGTKSIDGPASAAPLLQTVRDGLSETASARIFHLPRKPSLDALLKMRTAKPNPAGLRQVFKAPNLDAQASPSEKYQDIIDWIPERPIDTKHRETARLEATATLSDFGPILAEDTRIDLPKPPRGALLLRTNSDEAVPTTSFKAHRRQRSRCRSRDVSMANSIVFDETARLDLTSHRGFEQGLLSALMEISTPGYTPQYGPDTGRRMTLEALEGRKEGSNLFEKRLPTLPNTPSSACLPTKTISPPRNQASRFSASTFETSNRMASVTVDEQYQPRSLEYSDAAIWSPLSASTIDDSICSPFMAEDFMVPALRPISSNAAILVDLSDEEQHQQSQIRASILSCTTISSSVSTTPTTSRDESDNIDTSFFSDVTSHCPETAGRFSDTASRCSDTTSFSGVTSIRSSAMPYNAFQHYSLPEIENASEVTLKRYEPQDYGRIDNGNMRPGNEENRRSSSLSHSENMQQLINELSYLSEMIQH